MVTPVLELTAEVLTVNLALAVPAETVTVAGTVAAFVLLLLSITTAPPAGAGPDKVTAPCELVPPTTLVGLNVNEERVSEAAGKTVRVAVCVAP